MSANKNNIIPSLIQVGLAANIFEWYQFSIMAFLEPTIGLLFFDHVNLFYATLAGFSFFAISFLFRPLGSIIFSCISEKYGAGYSLKLSLVTMALPGILIGILPTFSYIGYMASISLILLRILQGIGAGGELPISGVYLYQMSMYNRYQALYCSLASVSGLAGVMCASLSIFILHLFLSPSTITQWGWRIPFLLIIPMGLFIYHIRSGIQNIPNGILYQKHNHIFSRSNIIIKFIQAISLVSLGESGFYTLFVWLPSNQIQQYALGHNLISLANVIGFMFLIFFVVLSAYISSKISYIRLLKISSISIILTTIPLFIVLHYVHNFIILMSILFIFACNIGMIIGLTFYTLARIFRDYYLSIGVAISFTFATIIFGGTAPIICTYFTHVYNLDYFAGMYVTFFAVIYLIVNKLLPITDTFE